MSISHGTMHVVCGCCCKRYVMRDVFPHQPYLNVPFEGSMCALWGDPHASLHTPHQMPPHNPFLSLTSALLPPAHTQHAPTPLRLSCRLGGSLPLDTMAAQVSHVLNEALLMVNAQRAAAAAAAASSGSSGGLGAAGSGSTGAMGPPGGAAGSGSGSAWEGGVVAGGYMCREVSGDMKYMLAFGCPEVRRYTVKGGVFDWG